MKFFLIFLLFLCGCNREVEMFENPKLLTDKDGNRYVVEHHVGNTFTVRKID